MNEVKDNLRKTVAENKDIAPEKIINNIKCPFLQNEACSIYLIRPLICRMFGSFATKTALNQVDGNIIFTCEMEKDRWNMEIEQNILKSLVLPNRDYFYNKLEELNNKKEAIFLINHIDNYFNS